MESIKYKVVVATSDPKDGLLLCGFLRQQHDLVVEVAIPEVTYIHKLIRNLQPELLFVSFAFFELHAADILAPMHADGSRGFEVVVLLDGCQQAQTVLQQGGFDYLMNPHNQDELDKTLIRFRAFKSSLQTGKNSHPGLLRLPETDKFCLPTPEGKLFLSAKEMAYFRSYLKHCQVIDYENKTYEVCFSMKKLIHLLEDKEIFCVHKSYGINKLYLLRLPKSEKFCWLRIFDALVKIPLSTKGKRKLNS